MSNTDLADFATQLQQDLLSEASIVGEERMIRDVSDLRRLVCVSS